MVSSSAEEVRNTVRERYARVAETNGAVGCARGCCGANRCLARAAHYKVALAVSRGAHARRARGRHAAGRCEGAGHFSVRREVPGSARTRETARVAGRMLQHRRGRTGSCHRLRTPRPVRMSVQERVKALNVLSMRCPLRQARRRALPPLPFARCGDPSGSRRDLGVGA
jgi:hypothetical protein